MKNVNYERYSSKIKRINIPVPTYSPKQNSDHFRVLKIYHTIRNWWLKASVNSISESLIGRDVLVEKLKNLLLRDKKSSGSYLVTGYRGMGKTSYVNRVINELSGEVSFFQEYLGRLCFLIISLSPVFMVFYGLTSWWHYAVPIFCLALWYFVPKWFYLGEKIKLLKLRFYVFLERLHNDSWSSVFSCEKITKKEWTRAINLLYGANLNEKSFSRLAIKINLSQEILHEKDILSLLTFNLLRKFRNYKKSTIANFEHFALVALLSMIVGWFIQQATSPRFAPIGFPSLSWYFCTNFLVLLLIQCVLIFVIYNIIFFYNNRIFFRLAHLNKMLDASFEEERRLNLSVALKGISPSSNVTNRFKYDVAGVRLIESQLIDVLTQISKLVFSPSIYFVIDELDKIENTLLSKEDSMQEYSNERNFPGGGASRRRKYAVMHLLANLKYFTTTAPAKFIFIAGREMYDGYEADMTDRESAASSLFDEVLYVESFCKNEKSDRNVTYNAETFIVRKLIPAEFIQQRVYKKMAECQLKKCIYENIDIDLKLYYEYLVENYIRFLNKYQEDKNKPKISVLPEEYQLALTKTILLLYHFSVYLHQLSNGSPKKMKMNFDDYVRAIKRPIEFRFTKDKVKKKPLQSSDIDILIPQKARYLLSFDEKDQRIIGFFHYLSFPINQIMNNADRFSDKLLVSASFLINHLYKYHKGGFSWRNLEHTPELLEVYKIPEFRSFISSILNYLLQNHIIHIQEGIYQYKFRKQISEEISFASKISEDVSAVYNFTLDDSQSVKRHYLERNRELSETLKSGDINDAYAATSYHQILGDLHLSDEEYNNAIEEYLLAIRILKKNKQNEHGFVNPRHLITYMRNMMKVALAYEKRNSNLSAYNAYNNIIDELFKFRAIDEKGGKLTSLQLIGEVQQLEHWPYQRLILFPQDVAASQSIEPKVQLLPVDDTSTGKQAFSTRGSRLVSDFSYQLTLEKHEVMQRLAAIADTRFIHQAMLARLFVIEKMELEGITRENLDVIEGEFQYLMACTNEKEKYLISCEFYRRLGDIMYYKNGLIGTNFSHSHDEVDNDQIEERFIDSLFYFGFNIKKEIHDFCRKHSCFEAFPDILSYSRLLVLSGNMISHSDALKVKNIWAVRFWEDSIVKSKIDNIKPESVSKCNNRRKELWIQNRSIPCFACGYYHRSLDIMLFNLFGVNRNVNESRAVTILRQIALKGSAQSSRQIVNIEFAEILDNLGHTLFSCSTHKVEISKAFLDALFHDIELFNQKFEFSKNLNDKAKESAPTDQGKGKMTDNAIFLQELCLLKKFTTQFSNLEIALLYFFEASIMFQEAGEMKKAVGSLHKMLKVFLSYLKVSKQLSKESSEESSLDELHISRSILLGEYIPSIKQSIVKPALRLLYNHFNYININEIQRLKWIFSVQMYEDIPLSNLSLFPTIESLMLNYYDLIRVCIVPTDKMHEEDSSLHRRNRELHGKLATIYRHVSMGSLRIESTVFERMQSLRFKTVLNEYILWRAFPSIKLSVEDRTDYFTIFYQCFFTSESNKLVDRKCLQSFFSPNDKFREIGSDVTIQIDLLLLFEHLIKDSMYCLTEILETVTPYTSNTLFTDSFIAGIYRHLNRWTRLHDALYQFYRFFDVEASGLQLPTNDNGFQKLSNNFIAYLKAEDYSDIKQRVQTVHTHLCQEWKCKSLSSRFFQSVMSTIKKSNNLYTLRNYSAEMAIKFYRRAKEINREGKTYRELISRMYYLDDDLKNDTIQFDLAIERFKINSDYIDHRLTRLSKGASDNIYDIERYVEQRYDDIPFSQRFTDSEMNLQPKSSAKHSS